MNITLVILGIVLVILVYVLYKYATVGSGTTLSTNASLKATNPPITSIGSPTSVRYAYGLWIYVNTWDSTIKKTIFSRNKNISLYLDALTPSLKCDITMSDSNVQSVLITDNFPIQKWVYVVMSVDNQIIDAYLDGKLVKSQRVYVPATSTSPALMPLSPPDSTTPIILGGNPFDAVITKFNRWTSPVDPQTVWNAYLSGNGSTKFGSSFQNFNANLSIMKNNMEYSKVALF